MSCRALTCLVLSIALPCLVWGDQRSEDPVFVYASRSGKPTFDADANGGNPFATAVVQLLARQPLSFAAFKTDLAVLTRDASGGSQRPEVVGGDRLSSWQFLPKPEAQTYAALVVMFSDYSRSDAGRSLPGARRDLVRISDALSRAGFEVQRLEDPDGKALTQALKDFRSRTARADVALIYTTGHGVEAGGIARILLPYTRADGNNELPVSELANATQARRVNLVFYAACRFKPRTQFRSSR